MQLKKSSLFLDNRNKKTKELCPYPSAIIDVGTNTVRLLIGCVTEEKVMRLATRRAVTRLGKDILKTGKLSKLNIIKSIEYITKFKVICNTYAVKEIRAVGTSALREAKNSDEFLAQTKKITGMDIEIISGAKEAELTLKGVLGSGLKTQRSRKKESKPFFIGDIGGGSTEWIHCSGSELMMDSIPIGAVKLFDAFIKNDPPAPDELGKMEGYIKNACSNSLLLKNIFTDRSYVEFIATGGTAATLAAIDMAIDKYDGDKIHLHKITLPTLKSIYKKLIMLSAHERSKIKGLEADRADIIIPGTLILLILMEYIHARTLIVSDYGLLEGALISYHVL
ncbi:MAG: hypothetical protein A2077_02565 [Nitrospirae bacterium GWC2_46_6]|nr:MAG: hypothetical protein A2077_02565 [Nitrospirae bacterium GWC2_46_6]OGW22924.1 MAG: hypothetical protein A2X55_07870 [Nitrospirae bacterium GWB2_47_37]HAK88764.1 hypothetical protein [Nitrospiraceae bacterium]HCL81367.1 hypothetical protein [Nitrospiraceae bacterium]HCZ11087.1 hypothetical protein [Nitrospiraceae bacterium]